MRVYGGQEVIWVLCIAFVGWLGLIVAIAGGLALSLGNAHGVVKALVLIAGCAAACGYAHTKLRGDTPVRR